MQENRIKSLVRAFLLVAVVAVLAAAPASAQLSFNVTSSAQTVRTEGQTETAGSVNMTLAANAQPTISTGSSITLTYATASVLTGSPFVSAKMGGVNCASITTGNCSNMTVTTSGSSVIISFNGPTPSGVGAVLTGGDFIQVAETRLNIANVTGAQPVTGTTPLLATISGNSPSANTITFNQNQVQVATISSSLNVKLGAAQNFSTCAVAPAILSVVATEVFPAAVTTAGDEVSFTPHLAPAPTGSIINVVLSNVPTGFVLTPQTPTQSPAITAGAPPVTVPPAATPGAQTSTGVGSPLTFAYTITGDSTSIVEGFTFGFSVGLASGTVAPTLNSQSLASPQSIGAQVFLGPVTNTATTVVRFTQLSYPASPITVATISDCTSLLLFPYVTNEASFDTSITIANTTTDGAALGTQAAAKAQGTCKFILYPTAAATGAVGTTQTSFVTPTIQSGGSYQVLLSKAYPKLSGYMIAVCNFLDAHGFGYFVGPSSNGGVLTQGELALVIPSTRGTGALAGIQEGLLQ